MAAAESTMLRQNGGGGIGSLPPGVMVGPDENGVRKVFQYRLDDKGNKFEIVTTITPVGKLARAHTTRNSIKRNSTPSSADATEDDAKSRLTNVSTEGIPLERPHFSGNKAQEPVPMVLMQCLICCTKGHHWTIKCPFRAQATVDKSPIVDGPSPPSEAVKRANPVKGVFRPRRIRDDAKRIMNDDTSVRVTNLSKEAREHHLVDLFRVYGFVTHVYIPVGENGSSRGVGYVKFAHRRQAESAIKKVNGLVYENLTLQVGWAVPRLN